MATTSFIMAIGKKQAELFVANNIGYCEFMVTATTPRTILNLVYNYLVRDGKITALENLTLDEKRMSWETAKDFAKGRLNETELIEVVKSLHALEFLL